MPPLDPLVGYLVAPLVDPTSRTWWGGLVLFALVALVAARPGWPRRVLVVLRHPSSLLDLQLLIGGQLLRALIGVPTLATAWWLATHGVRLLDATVGAPALTASPWSVALGYTLVIFVVGDASRFALHLAVHRVPALWALHQVHHSAVVLTPLTFHRLHPLESVLHDLRAIAVAALVGGGFWWAFRDATTGWTLLGVPALGLGLNVVFGNLRHSHVWLRFPARLERWLISPAQHQLHHAAAPEHHHANLGTWLAVWDRLAGTLQVAGPEAPRAFGLQHPNHRNDLLSAWFGPLRGLVP